MLVNSTLALVILSIAAIVAIATIWKMPVTNARTILGLVIMAIGIISMLDLIPIIFFWALAGGTVCGIIAWNTGRKCPCFAQGFGMVMGIFIFIGLVGFSILLVPSYVIEEQTSVIELLPQDESGTLLYGTANARREYSAMAGQSEESIYCYYLYYSNESLKVRIIDPETKRLPSIDDKGYINTYRRYNMRDYSQWPYNLFFSGSYGEDKMSTFKVIYVSDEKIKVSPEFAIYYKGSPVLPHFFYINKKEVILYF